MTELVAGLLRLKCGQ